MGSAGGTSVLTTTTAATHISHADGLLSRTYFHKASHNYFLCKCCCASFTSRKRTSPRPGYPSRHHVPISRPSKTHITTSFFHLLRPLFIGTSRASLLFIFLLTHHLHVYSWLRSHFLFSFNLLSVSPFIVLYFSSDQFLAYQSTILATFFMSRSFYVVLLSVSKLPLRFALPQNSMRVDHCRLALASMYIVFRHPPLFLHTCQLSDPFQVTTFNITCFWVSHLCLVSPPSFLNAPLALYFLCQVDIVNFPLFFHKPHCLFHSP